MLCARAFLALITVDVGGMRVYASREPYDVFCHTRVPFLEQPQSTISIFPLKTSRKGLPAWVLISHVPSVCLASVIVLPPFLLLAQPILRFARWAFVHDWK
jgi:hypothetical protein